ncbi:uncharacterized protein PITG_00306 [Phytophthora infestans T30-4]|uniref:Uncharacterized protein n=1 Tax=Phytophthora infestans (strain T30-4) TaxID=403677 RepID=D0MQG9_PHYIT|nr:uncharacterized protein PITG_00306 [Phytophthora infestans T30-4]EEY57738.1 conserved hypothetical protein [Phytophthora infestans T30-4]|eukprot:XP_002908924.1 conserved hypothetical protein [Phytophthora infestans T30-4]
MRSNQQVSPTKSLNGDLAGVNAGPAAAEPEAKGQQDLQHALARFFLARGNAFRAIGELERAAKDYGSAITLDDRSALYFANRGACYRKLNQTAKALEDLTTAIELDGRKAPHYFNRALVMHDAGFYREAIIDFSKALEDGSTAGNTVASNAGVPGGGIGLRVEYRALQSRANCYRRLGHLSKCIDDLQAAIKLDPRNASAFSALALAHFECGDFELAADEFTQAIELNSGSASYFSYRGLCYYRQGQEAAAKQRQQRNAPPNIFSGMGTFARQCLADFNKCIQLDGRDPQAYFYRGSVRLALAYMSAAEQLEAAFADIEMACTLCPTGIPYQIGMAMIMQLKQQHSEARSMLEAIATGSSETRKSVLVQFHTALCCHALGDYERAVELLTDALDALPDEPIFLEARGLMLQEMRVHPLALADFTHALGLLESREDHKAGLNQLLALRYLRGESALRLEHYQDTVDDCSAAIAGGYTADMAAQNARGMAFRGLGDYDSALQDLNACVAQAPKNDIFRFHRALCLMECSRYSEALPDLHETATRNSTDTKLLYYMGLCYYHERQLTECVSFLKRALVCKPAQDLLPHLYYHMGLSYALEGENMDAVEHFTSAYDHSLIQSQLQQLHEAQLMYIHERAKALQLERYHAEALADFSFVIAQQPTNAHAYFRRGFAHKALGDFKAAAHDLQTARLLDPNNLQLVVNYKELRDVECIVLCPPGDEKRF